MTDQVFDLEDASTSDPDGVVFVVGGVRSVAEARASLLDFGTRLDDPA